MKLKREYISFMNFSKVFKGLLLFSALLLTHVVSAQLVSITSSDNVAAEVTAPGAQNLASFTISRPGGTLSVPEVEYTVTGTATSGDDHDLDSGSVILPLTGAGTDSEVTVNINSITDDLLVEGLETIIVTLTSVNSTGTINPAADEVTINITDNDVGIVSMDTVGAAFIPTATEGGANGRFRLQSDKVNGTGAAVTITFTITGTSGPSGSGAGFDHNLTGVNAAKTAATIPNNSRLRNINVIPFDDTATEADKTVIITLTGTNNANFTIDPANDTATVTIIDDDCIAGETAPVLNNDVTEFCGAFSIALDSYFDGVLPAGVDLVWSTDPDPTETDDWLLPGAGNTIDTPDTYYAFFADVSEDCYSPTTTHIITQSNEPSAGTPIANIPTACNNADDDFTPRILDLDLLITGEDAGDWSQTGGPSVGAIPNNGRINFDNRAAGDYEFTHTTTGAVSPCTNQSVAITITVEDCDPCVAGNNPPVLSPGAPDTVYCRDAGNNEMIALDLDDFTNTTPPAGTELRWTTISDLENEGAHLPSSDISISTGQTYRGFFWDDVNDCASPALVVSILIRPIPVLTVGEDQERCGPGTLTFTASASLNATINWYASDTSPTIIGTGSSFTTPVISASTSYFVEATLNNCASERQQVNAIVQQQPSSGTAQNGGNASSCSASENGPTILDLDDLISGEDAGAWAFTSGPIPDFMVPSNNILNFVGRPDGEYVFTYTTSEAEAPCMNESTVITITVNDCDVDTDMDGLFDGPEATLGTDPNNPDSDGDGIEDGDEVGSDIENPLDSDVDSEGRNSPDGIIDALDSNILDSDNDGVVDQLDPANANPCVPTRLNGVCDFDEDGIPDSDEVADGSDPDDPCDPDLENSACNAEVDLEVLKSVDNLNALIGETVVFTITVNNLSDNRASKVIIGDLLESGFEYVSHSPETEQYDPDTGSWDIALIDPMDNAVLEITVNILEGGTYTNTAELLDVFQTDTNPANDRSEPITLPIELPEGIDLIVEKTALSANPLVNAEVVFTIKVINASIDTNPVNNIEVSDVLDTENFEYIDHNTLAGEYDEGSGIWSIPSINKDEEVTLEIRVRVPNEGKFINTAAIIRSSPADGNPANNEATVEVTVSLPTPADVGFLFNQFSPNGDGTNDILKINRLNAETNQEVEIVYSIQIFNRYGNLVFESFSASEGEVWNGSWEGKEAPNGTYFYTMNLDIGDGAGPRLKKGWIQLIR